MEVGCAVIELKPGSSSQVTDWAQYLNDHMAEALATLAHEGVTVESWFRVNLQGQDYLIATMRAADLQAAHAVVHTSTSALDAFHQAFKKATWGSRIPAELLVDLSRIPDEEKFA
ncbi:MAG: DUF6176 family protein [Inhella sp.]